MTPAKAKELETRKLLGPRLKRSPRLERVTAEPRRDFRVGRSGAAVRSHPTRDSGST